MQKMWYGVIGSYKYCLQYVTASGKGSLALVWAYLNARKWCDLWPRCYEDVPGLNEFLGAISLGHCHLVGRCDGTMTTEVGNLEKVGRERESDQNYWQKYVCVYVVCIKIACTRTYTLSKGGGSIFSKLDHFCKFSSFKRRSLVSRWRGGGEKGVSA